MMKLKTILAFLCLSLYAQAQETGRSLYITLKGDTKAEFNLAKEPSISNSTLDMKLWIYWENEQGISYNLLDVESITFGAPSTAIKTMRQTEGAMQGDYFVAPKSRDGISVYTLDGRKMEVNTTDADNSTLLDLRQLPKGVYVISYSGNSFKMQKR